MSTKTHPVCSFNRCSDRAAETMSTETHPVCCFNRRSDRATEIVSTETHPVCCFNRCSDRATEVVSTVTHPICCFNRCRDRNTKTVSTETHPVSSFNRCGAAILSSLLFQPLSGTRVTETVSTETVSFLHPSSIITATCSFRDRRASTGCFLGVYSPSRPAWSSCCVTGGPLNAYLKDDRSLKRPSDWLLASQ